MKRATWHYGMAAVLVLAMAGVSVGDDWSRWHERDDRYSQKEARERQKLYDRGFKDGQKDRQHHHAFEIRKRGFDDRQDRDSYVAGYRAGYGSGVYRR